MIDNTKKEKAGKSIASDLHETECKEPKKEKSVDANTNRVKGESELKNDAEEAINSSEEQKEANSQDTAIPDVNPDKEKAPKAESKPAKKEVANFAASATPAFGWHADPSGNPLESVPFCPPQPSAAPVATVAYTSESVSELDVSLLSLSFEPLDRAKKGFVNTHVSCYANVVLQSLLACTPFYNLLSQLARQIEPQPEKAQPSASYLKCFTEMYRYFCVENQHKRGRYQSPVVSGEAIFEKIIATFDLIHQQQDSQEFLCYLLDGMHKELLSIKTKSEQPEESKSDDDDWMEMGDKKVIKYNNSETGNSEKSLISDIFGGIFKSELTVSGKVHSTATYEPFYLLSLDISQSDSIPKAMQFFFRQEELSDYFDEVTKTRVKAEHKQLIERLPSILVVHLKRFIYSRTKGVIHKLQASVAYGEVLVIEEEFLSSRLKAQNKGKTPMYQLVGVISHMGKTVQKGHYMCCTRDCNGKWEYYDDSKHHSITLHNVLLMPEVYVLIYEQMKA
eukprot:TRINITY_DN12824_c0_g1_i7.p1 TRINITY_DN12824_c0_g1~~TRINITY_DN12824_c0_g1_i7.p1  ORF type:complete len:507 (-),score=120.47 TRINITY_DN12824_c0_g1_i7:58-1578(-)